MSLLDLAPDEIIVDNFAGGGGASEGIEEGFADLCRLAGIPEALFPHVAVAINHDPEAVAMHYANHPRTRHYCESVWEVDPRTVMPGMRIGLLWLSPDCKHFSKAKGKKPVEKKIRGLAWVGMRWVALRRPRVIMLENVEEFVTWGPLIVDAEGNQRPDPRNKGREFNAFVNALKRHGYEVDWRELRASDYGAPTIRKRLFLIARCDGQPIVWPEPTHAPADHPDVLAGRLLPQRTAASDVLDFNIECPSIFERKRPLAEATCRRIAKGIMRYVVNTDQPFIVRTDQTSGKPERKGVHSVDSPVNTLHTANAFALVAPVLTECANASSPRSMPANEPLRTQCAEVKGGHHALVTAFMAKHYGGVVGHGLKGEPVHTVTASDHNSLVTTYLQRDFGKSVGSEADGPVPTVTAGGGGHVAEVRAFLIKYYGADQDPRLDEPLHTVTTKDRYGLVTVNGEDYAIADIGMRMLTPRELFRAQGFRENYIIDKGRIIDQEGNILWIPLTKTAQVRMCGNSVCPPMAAALVKANFRKQQSALLAA